MKKIFVYMLMSVAFFTYCSQDDSSLLTTENSSVSSVPSSIEEYINENYPDTEIKSITEMSNSGSASYLVILGTYEQLNIEVSGNSIINVELKSLCDSTYTDSTISDSASGHHRHHGHHGHQGHGHHCDWVNVDSLPSSIAEYVTANYAGYSVHNAQYDSLCQFGPVINVMIDSSKAAHHKLIFDTAGSYLSLAHRLDSASVPEDVWFIITSNYSDYTVRKRTERFTLADNSIQYRVFLHQDTVKLSVALSATGTVICEQ